MGVKACQRPSCEHIMCDRLVLGNYLCDDCFAELQEFRESWPEEMTALEVKEHVERFLESEPGAFKKLLSPEEVEREFRRLTGGGRDES